MCADRPLHRQAGLTIIELIVFIVIVGTALAGVLTVLSVAVRGSADPVIRKQGLAIAESLLEEVMSQPFTWCDPDDRSAATATSAVRDVAATDPTKCWDAVEGIGRETVSGVQESRGNPIYPLDNVSDYDGLQTNTSITGGGSAPYSASITEAPAVLNGIGDNTASSAALLITVTVRAGDETLRVQGYRTRHSPNLLP